MIASFDWMDKEENIGIPRREIKYFSERFEKAWNEEHEDDDSYINVMNSNTSHNDR